ncbi:unnamed protein product [Sphenostylis stenocarpa]|uniref:Uncharacterized protein n=1 Tax=Sphenostylis stenocarpa TaxID=92480 RepID=A0AA86T4C3_9FABA|nr:unnamed protein product [Sphenostylis stenocarpa]
MEEVLTRNVLVEPKMMLQCPTGVAMAFTSEDCVKFPSNITIILGYLSVVCLVVSTVVGYLSVLPLQRKGCSTRSSVSTH